MYDDEVKELYSVLSDFSQDFADDFLYSKDKEEWLAKNGRVLESLEGFTEKYGSVKAMRTNRVKALSELFQEQIDYKDKDGNVMKPTEERVKVLQQKLPYITKKEVDEWFDKTNQYIRDQKKEAEYRRGVNMRTREVNDWNLLKKLFTTDYEKQRYIYDPKSATFGEEAPGLIGSSWGSKGDIISGVLGGAADVVPTPIATQYWLGPAIRTGRDIGYAASESPYAKSGEDIAKDAVIDLGVNAGAEIFRNWRTATKGRNILASQDPEVARYLRYDAQKANIVEGYKRLSDFVRSIGDRNLTKAEFINFVEKNVPDSHMKQELLGSAAKVSEINQNNLADILDTYRKNIETESMWKDMANSKIPYDPEVMGRETPFATDMALAPENLTKGQKAKVLGLKGFDLVKEKASTGATKFTGRESGQSATKTKPDYDKIESTFLKNILNSNEWYKTNYRRDWRSGMLVPKKDKKDPMARAYFEWYKETYNEPPKGWEDWEYK